MINRHQKDISNLQKEWLFIKETIESLDLLGWLNEKLDEDDLNRIICLCYVFAVAYLFLIILTFPSAILDMHGFVGPQKPDFAAVATMFNNKNIAQRS